MIRDDEVEPDLRSAWTQWLPPSETSWGKALLHLHFVCNKTNVILKDFCINQPILTSFISFPWICYSFVFPNRIEKSSQHRVWNPCLLHGEGLNTCVTVLPRIQTNFLFGQVLKVNKLRISPDELQLNERVVLSNVLPQPEDYTKYKKC